MLKGDELGRWRLEREVGRGGAGVVFRARGPDGQPAALKLFRPRAPGEERGRFVREVEAMLRLHHPGVVRILDAGERPGPGASATPWLAMEWIEGESLEARLRKQGPIEPRQAAQMVARVARALEHCHAQGVLHRDLKPANVLLRAADGVPLLADFGLAADPAGPGSLSTTGQLLGTPSYWAPEQAHADRAAVGPRTDVWGLGAVLFALLTARPPRTGTSLTELILEAEREVPSPRSLRPGVPLELERICRRCLALDPADRWPDAAAVALELERFAAPRAHAGGRTRLFAAAALVILVVGALGAWGVVVPRRRAARVRELFEEARARVERGDHAGALPLFEAALALDPRSVDLLVGRGVARSRTGDDAGALEDYDQVLAIDPEHLMARVSRGIRLVQTGRPKEALPDFERALARDPLNVRALIGRAKVRNHLGDLDGASADLDRALELYPDEVAALVERAEIAIAQNDPNRALPLLDRALELQPSHANGRFGRAAIRRARGDLEGALADLLRIQADGLTETDVSPHIAEVRREIAAR